MSMAILLNAQMESPGIIQSFLASTYSFSSAVWLEFIFLAVDGNGWGGLPRMADMGDKASGADREGEGDDAAGTEVTGDIYPFRR